MKSRRCVVLRKRDVHFVLFGHNVKTTHLEVMRFHKTVDSSFLYDKRKKVEDGINLNVTTNIHCFNQNNDKFQHFFTFV